MTQDISLLTAQMTIQPAPHQLPAGKVQLGNRSYHLSVICHHRSGKETVLTLTEEELRSFSNQLQPMLSTLDPAQLATIQQLDFVWDREREGLSFAGIAYVQQGTIQHQKFQALEKNTALPNFAVSMTQRLSQIFLRHRHLFA